MTGRELLQLWLASGLSQRQLARKLGLNFNSMHGKIHRAQQSEGKLTNDKNERVEMKEEANSREYTSKSRRIKTLDQLIEQCEINLDEWIIDRHIVNKWEVGAKVTEKDLEWNAGIIDGYVKSEGNLIIEPLFQVKAWLTKRNPEPIMPVITPVEIALDKPYKQTKPKKAKHGRVLVLADMHFGFRKDVKTGQLEPFHDREALAVSLAMIEDVNPDIIVIVGDILDLAEWSDKFVRSPDMYNTTQPAVVEAAWWLSQIRMIFDGDIYLLEGNHEKRLTTTINKSVPAAFGLSGARDGLPVLSVPILLGLEDLGVAYIPDYPNEELWLSDNLRATHGATVRAKAGATAGAILDDAQATTIFGHIHRTEMATKTLHGILGARTVAAFSPGCLCRIDGAVPAVKAKMNWQQGIGVVDFDSTFVQITPVPIEQGVAMYQGKHYKGKNYVPRLRAETGWAF